MWKKAAFITEWVEKTISILGLFAAGIWFLFTNFVTTTSHEKALASMKEYVDSTAKSQQSTLNDIKSTVERIDQRVYELHKERGE